MKSRRRVVITGLGVVSPLGCNLATFWCLLSSGHSGIAPISCFDTSPFSSCLGGEVKDFEAEDFIPRKKARRMGRVSHFAVAASLMAVRDSGLNLELENRSETAICLGTSVAGLREAFDAHECMLEKRHMNPFTMTATFPNAVSAEIAIALGVHGECETYSIGCSSTANAIGRAYELIHSNRADIVVAGGAEAPLHPTIFSAMAAGRVLAPDQQGMVRDLPRPFDRNRCGMVMGEGAGCLVLEDLEHAIRRGAPVYAEVEGWGFTCDAYSMVQPSATGKEQRRAIEKALAIANWFPEEVDYVNACGLGTIDMDALETVAIKEALGEHAYRVPVTSFKPMLGHAFAASGAFQLIGSALAMEHQFVPPTMNLAHPDPACDLDYVAMEGRPLRVDKVLINSFGFGGKNIVLALSRVDAVTEGQRVARSNWQVAYEGLAGVAPALARSGQSSDNDHERAYCTSGRRDISVRPEQVVPER